MADRPRAGGRRSAHRDLDPNRPGTVYRTRPKLLKFGRGGGSAGVGAGWRSARPGATPDRPDAANVADATAAPHYGAAGVNYDAVPSYDVASGRGRTAGRGGRPGYVPPNDGSPELYGAPGRRRRRWPWVLAVLLVLLVGYPLLLGGTAWSDLRKVDALPASGGPADTPGRTYLVVGSDSRQDLTRAERARLGTGQAAGQRTDTIMLLHVPSGGGPTVLISVPRDSYLPIPAHGKNKINSAYAFGGPQLLVRTIEQATNLHIDEYVETGLGGYANLVDAIGGVRICVKRAMNDAKAHINLKAGCQQLDGKTALGYARARYSDPLGDLGRVQRQREVLAAIAGKTLSPSVIALPWLSFPAARAGGGALTVDSGTSPVGLAQFVLAMRSVSGGQGLSLTVPVARDNLRTPNAGIAVEWNQTRANALFAALRADDTEKVRPLADAQKKVTK